MTLVPPTANSSCIPSAPKIECPVPIPRSPSIEEAIIRIRQNAVEVYATIGERIEESHFNALIRQELELSYLADRLSPTDMMKERAILATLGDMMSASDLPTNAERAISARVDLMVTQLYHNNPTRLLKFERFGVRPSYSIASWLTFIRSIGSNCDFHSAKETFTLRDLELQLRDAFEFLQKIEQERRYIDESIILNSEGLLPSSKGKEPYSRLLQETLAIALEEGALICGGWPSAKSEAWPGHFNMMKVTPMRSSDDEPEPVRYKITWFDTARLAILYNPKEKEWCRYTTFDLGREAVIELISLSHDLQISPEATLQSEHELPGSHLNDVLKKYRDHITEYGPGYEGVEECAFSCVPEGINSLIFYLLSNHPKWNLSQKKAQREMEAISSHYRSWLLSSYPEQTEAILTQGEMELLSGGGAPSCPLENISEI